jgi:hypothetical protein
VSRAIVEPCPACIARQGLAGRPQAASQFARVVIVAQDLAASRGAERVEAVDLQRAADHVRREVSA